MEKGRKCQEEGRERGISELERALKSETAARLELQRNHDILQRNYDSDKTIATNKEALMMSFDLITLFRNFMKSVDWQTVTNQYGDKAEQLDNYEITDEEFDLFNASVEISIFCCDNCGWIFAHSVSIN